jgi:catechol 1,2-dioxygenase
VVFAVKSSLIRQFTLNESPEAAAKWGTRGAFWELDNDFVLSKSE